MICKLYPWQEEALKKLHNGCILFGTVGSGKSRTSLAYVYEKEYGGVLNINGKNHAKRPSSKDPKPLYIITTAAKRDTKEWELEVAYFDFPKNLKVTIDSWNNIKKYVNVVGAVFILDEQRLTGMGAWVKAFYKIAKKNHWILLSGTPGDTYKDYIPVLIANGFYKNKTDFNSMHVVFKPYMNFPCIDHYVFTKLLDHNIEQILVKMNPTFGQRTRHDYYLLCNYDKVLYKTVMKDRWDPYDLCPIEETGKLMYLLRKVVNSDASRIEHVRKILSSNDKVIIFYNFSYELHMLRDLLAEMGYDESEIGERNGEKHIPVPKTKRWVHLCQYTAAAEGWNCIDTDTIIFFSQNYSYKVLEQSKGRIDRANTSFKDLHYYHLTSTAKVDLAIKRALSLKRDFNEKIFMNGVRYDEEKDKELQTKLKRGGKVA